MIIIQLPLCSCALHPFHLLPFPPIVSIFWQNILCGISIAIEDDGRVFQVPFRCFVNVRGGRLCQTMVWKKARLQKTHGDIANTVCIFTRIRGTQAIVTSIRCTYYERLTVQNSFQETNPLKMETLKPGRDRQNSKIGIGGEG